MGSVDFLCILGVKLEMHVLVIHIWQLQLIDLNPMHEMIVPFYMTSLRFARFQGGNWIWMLMWIWIDSYLSFMIKYYMLVHTVELRPNIHFNFLWIFCRCKKDFRKFLICVWMHVPVAIACKGHLCQTSSNQVLERRSHEKKWGYLVL